MPWNREGGLLARLASIAESDERLVVGLSSGTSIDGVDAALVRVVGRGVELDVELLRFACLPFPGDLAERIAGARRALASEIARLNFEIGEAFARAALRVIELAGHVPSEIHLIGSHGQTVYHEPSGDRSGVTFQIGEADVIAARTGVVTISDFRTADVAVGGSGAPLVPFVDWLLFRRTGEPRLLLNVGGMANITYVSENLEDVVAFDTGPGNALMDEIVRAATGASEVYDRDGIRALRGQVSEAAVETFLTRPYFAARPPKSTGKELFGQEAAHDLARLVHGDDRIEEMGERAVDDLLATAAAVTARSIHRALAFLPDGPPPALLAVSGGGVRNRAVMRMLGELFSPTPVLSLAELGMDPDAKEAVAFAVLASEAIDGVPGNVPAATGASRPSVLGKISPAM